MRFCGIIMLAAATLARADLVELTTGQKLEGSVTTFDNMTFELITDQGVSKLAAVSVRKIAFEQRGAPATIETRTKGSIEGNVTAFENSTFTVQPPSGDAEKIPALLVRQASFGGGAARDIDIITHGGRVDVAKHLVRGKITLVDFYADWCGPCRMISPMLEKLAKEDRDVVLRKVDIVKWGTPVAQQYSINSIPHVEVYDRVGKLVGTVRGVNPDQVQKLVEQAKTVASVP